MKKRRLLTALFAASALLLVGCAKTGAPAADSASTAAQTQVPTASAQTAVYRKISPEDAQAMMDETEDYILLDVRTEEEYSDKHIEGALLIPDYELSERAAAELPDKEAIILVYCRSGRRSAASAKALVELGYQNVYDFGGINDWPYETVSGEV